MNRKQINKNQLLDMLHRYMLESNDPIISMQHISKTETMPVIYYGIHKGEYRFYADKINNQLIIKSYFVDKPDNFQTYHIGLNTASLLNIPRIVYDMIESRLIDNGYIL